MGLIMELMPGSLTAQLRDVSWTMTYLVVWPPTAFLARLMDGKAI
jgi:hypothetical protein